MKKERNMHIIIGVLTTITGLFWAITALQNSGAIDTLNPFLWYRRNQWKKKSSQKSIHYLSEPIDVAGLLIVGIAKIEGDLSRELKKEILSIFENEFHLSRNKSQQLFGSSIFIMKDEIITVKEVKNILSKSQNRFDQDKVDSLISILERVSKFDCKPNKGTVHIRA